MAHAALRIRVADATLQKRMELDDLHPETTVREMLDEAVPLLRLAGKDGRGRPLSYQAQLARERRHLHGSEKLGDAVALDDEVVISPSIEAGHPSGDTR